LTYFGAQGRMRGTASLAVKRPAAMRIELQGPHGGVLQAFATNGQEVQLADMTGSRFFYGPATPEHIDGLLGIAALGVGAKQWVELLFGEVAIPEDAALVYDGRRGSFLLTWQRGETGHRVDVDPETSRVTAAELRRNGKPASRVTVQERDDKGLPICLRLRAEDPTADVEVRLRDVAYDVPIEDAVFVLTPPRDVTPEYLGESSNIQRVY
jgi:hypothetical protein